MLGYLFNSKAFEKMDYFEGVAGGHYERMPVIVERDSGGKAEAITYVAGKDFDCDSGKPCFGYLHKIICGAKQHLLPNDYVDQIESMAK